MTQQLKRHSARLQLSVLPKKQGKAWLIDILGVRERYWIPDTFVKEFNPVQKTITIDTWILDKKGIKYKV